MTIQIIGVTGLPIIKAGDDIALMIVEATTKQGTSLRDFDVIVISYNSLKSRGQNSRSKRS